MSDYLLEQWGVAKKKPTTESFLDDMFGTGEDPQETQTIQYPVPSVDAAQETNSVEEANNIDEAELRILKAMLYRQLMNGSFFDDQNDIVAEVEGELREFANQKLQELLGMRQPENNTAAFSDDQVIILKALADNMAQNAKVMASIGKPVPKAKKPELKPALVAPAEPTLRTRPTPKGVGRPLGSKNVPKPNTINNVVKTSVAKPAAKGSVVVEDTKIIGIPAEDSVISEGGKNYIVKHNDLIDCPAADADKIKAMEPNTTMYLSDNTWVGCKAPGSYVRLRKVPKRGSGAGDGAPRLNEDQMFNVLSMQAQQAGSGLTPGVAIYRLE